MILSAKTIYLRFKHFYEISCRGCWDVPDELQCILCCMRASEESVHWLGTLPPRYLAMVTQGEGLTGTSLGDLTTLNHITLFHVRRKFHDLMAKLIKLLIPASNPGSIYSWPESWDSLDRNLLEVEVEPKLEKVSKNSIADVQAHAWKMKLLVRVTAAIRENIFYSWKQLKCLLDWSTHINGVEM